MVDSRIMLYQYCCCCWCCGCYFFNFFYANTNQSSNVVSSLRNFTVGLVYELYSHSWWNMSWYLAISSIGNKFYTWYKIVITVVMVVGPTYPIAGMWAAFSPRPAILLPVMGHLYTARLTVNRQNNVKQWNCDLLIFCTWLFIFLYVIL